MKRLLLKILILIYAFLFEFNGQAQTLNIDSCLSVLKTAKEDTSKVTLLSKIAWDVSYQSLQQGIEYSDQAISLAQKLHSETQYANVYHVAGTIYADLSEQGKAIDYFLNALKYAKKYNQTEVKAFIYNSLGNFFNKREDLRKAISYYLLSVAAHESFHSKKIYTPYNNLGIVYLKLKKIDSAIYYVNLCVEFSKTTNDKHRIAYNYIVLAQIYSQTKEKEKGLSYAVRAVEVSRTLNDKYTLSHALNQEGYSYFVCHQPEKAIAALNETAQLAKQTGDISTKQSCAFTLSDVYKEKRDFENALIQFKLYKSYEDSILNNESIQQVRTAEAKFENQKKQKEIELLAERQKLSDARREKQKLYLYFAIAGIAGLAFLIVVLFRNNRSKQKTNKALAAFNAEVKHQKELVEDKNKEITDSINYAQRIQHSILTSRSYFQKHSRDFFILFMPKDIVSGDFYWALQNEERFMVMTADCTGHGVPGAMMSMMGINFLNEIVNEKKIAGPAAVLNQLRKEIIAALNPEGSLVETKDGMDCTLCSFDFKNQTMTYSNANNRFYIIRDKNLIVSEVNKMPVGAGHHANLPFSEFEQSLQVNDLVITFTDGFADQFGGAKGKKFKYKQLEEVLLTYAHLPMQEIELKLEHTIRAWKGNLEQVDDICIVGIKI